MTSYDKFDEERSQLKVINALAVDIISITNQIDLAWYVAREVVGKLGFIDCIIYYLDPDRNVLFQAAAFGAKNPQTKEITNPMEIPVGVGITGTVAETRDPVIVANLKENDLYIADIDTALSEICVPLNIGDTIYGVIDCEDPELNHFTTDHLETLTTIASMMCAKLRLIEQNDHLKLMDELRFGEKRFRDFVDTASDWYWELDNELRYTYFSPKMENDENFGNSFFLGKLRSDVKPDGINEEHWKSHLSDLESHKPFRNFIQSRAVNGGKRIWQSINGTPWFCDKGLFQGYRGTGTDITNFMSAKEEAEEANHVKSQFMSTISHELRTPLTSSLGSLGLLSSLYLEELSEQGQELLEIISRNNKALLRLVNELLDYDKFLSGTLSIEVTPHDIGALVSRAINDLHGYAKVQSVNFEFHEPGKPIFAMAQKHMSTPE